MTLALSLSENTPLDLMSITLFIDDFSGNIPFEVIVKYYPLGSYLNIGTNAINTFKILSAKDLMKGLLGLLETKNRR